MEELLLIKPAQQRNWNCLNSLDGWLPSLSMRTCTLGVDKLTMALSVHTWKLLCAEEMSDVQVDTYTKELTSRGGKNKKRQGKERTTAIQLSIRNWPQVYTAELTSLPLLLIFLDLQPFLDKEWFFITIVNTALVVNSTYVFILRKISHPMYENFLVNS